MKKIMTVLAAALALTVFASCTYDADLGKKNLEKAEVDLTTAKVGYSLEIEKDGDKVKVPVVIVSTGDYSQSKIEFPYNGFPKVEVEFDCDGPVTIGFLPEGANPWDGRITGADSYYEAGKDQKVKIDVPAGAKNITFGSNKQTGVKITVKSVTLLAK